VMGRTRRSKLDTGACTASSAIDSAGNPRHKTSWHASMPLCSTSWVACQTNSSTSREANCDSTGHKLATATHGDNRAATVVPQGGVLGNIMCRSVSMPGAASILPMQSSKQSEQKIHHTYLLHTLAGLIQPHCANGAHLWPDAARVCGTSSTHVYTSV
jgi:hypothetical protein